MEPTGVVVPRAGSSSRRSRVAQASIEVGERVVAGPWSVLSQSRSQAEAAQDEAASQARGGKYSPSEPSGVRGGTKDDDDRRQNRAGPGRGPNKLCEGRWPASSSCTVSPARATTNTWRGGPMRDDFGPGTGGLQTQWRPGLRPGSLEATRRLQAASLMGVCRRSAMPTGMSSAAPMPAAPGDERRATACGKDAKRDEARRDETIPAAHGAYGPLQGRRALAPPRPASPLAPFGCVTGVPKAGLGSMDSRAVMPVLQIASHLLHGRLPSQAMHHDISSPARITAVSSPELPSPCSSRQQPCSNSKFWHKISSPSPIFAYYPGAVEHVRSIVRIKPLVADHPRGIHPPPLQLGSSQGGVLVAAAGGYPRFFLTMQRLRRFIARARVVVLVPVLADHLSPRRWALAPRSPVARSIHEGPRFVRPTRSRSPCVFPYVTHPGHEARARVRRTTGGGMEYSSVVGRNLLTWETRPSHSHLPQANVKNLTGAAPEWSAVSADVRVDGLADSLTRLWRGSIRCNGREPAPPVDIHHGENVFPPPTGDDDVDLVTAALASAARQESVMFYACPDGAIAVVVLLQRIFPQPNLPSSLTPVHLQFSSDSPQRRASPSLPPPIGSTMPRIAHVALVVRDYDEALAFYVTKLGFTLVEDTPIPEQNKRWVTIRPPTGPDSDANSGTTLLLAQASAPEQHAAIGNQTGGRVFLFLETDDFARDHARYTSAGVEWVREPVVQSYGTVAVFKDLYGNQWDLIERKK
ncbi:hypothetical protein PCL_02642 [Purpureocillium lilacinum]|uniref:VOC domain-containing protein n=3 Tax=Purpureocillium lilacinum TaxID=33203 RepID=A0A2U3DZM3_PURLI|nr:hypothetical protein PCL_02642 [Purpureocillium lilacinum]